VNNYSGGMAQRLMIARALMHQPRVLFLDEPTTGLDPQSRLFLWDQIEALRDAGTTILLTTHDMAEADRLCHRIAIVDHGERNALDTPTGLRELLPHARGLEITVSTDADPAAAFAALGEIESARSDGGWHVRAYGPEATPARALAAATAAGADVQDLARLDGSLEDVFVHLTGRDLR
jgi:ABC-2 type transport system ATP-binding protein